MQTAKKSSDMKSRMEEYMLGSLSARSEMMMRHKQNGMEYPPSIRRFLFCCELEGVLLSRFLEYQFNVLYVACKN